MNPNPTPESDSLASLVAQVIGDIQERQRRGERPDIEEYVARVPPQYASAIREVFAVVQVIDPPASPSTAPTDLPREPANRLRYRILRELGRGGPPQGCSRVDIEPGSPLRGEHGVIRITLTVTAGPHEGRVFSFEGHDTFVVGRSPRAQFRLSAKDRFFSRSHFLVEVNPPSCRLLDLGSRNGTYVNGRKVTAADLRHGDRIKAGRTILQVAVVTEPVAGGVGDTVPAAPPREAAGRPRESHPVPPSGACPLCGERLPPAGPGASADRTVAAAGRVCPACEAAVRRHPQPIPGYRLARELGRGGMGVVYLAMRTADGARVALKTITPTAWSQRAVQRFFREAGILRDLDHPHIVAFHEMGVAGDLLYFAMEYVPGTDAGQLLRAHGPLPVGRAVRWVCRLLQALDYAHAKGFVHRDIKPPNLLIPEDGNGEVVKLADFGLARVYLSSELSGLTMTREVGGTTAFMAPEQITHFREAQPPADQYAAAATLYNLLTGRYVYDLPRQTEYQLAMILERDPVPITARRPDLPEGLVEVVHRALAREPAARFPDVMAMRKALLLYMA
jgi:serine/threonine-protein kinase